MAAAPASSRAEHEHELPDRPGVAVGHVEVSAVEEPVVEIAAGARRVEELRAPSRRPGSTSTTMGAGSPRRRKSHRSVRASSARRTLARAIGRPARRSPGAGRRLGPPAPGRPRLRVRCTRREGALPGRPTGSLREAPSARRCGERSRQTALPWRPRRSVDLSQAHAAQLSGPASGGPSRYPRPRWSSP